MSNRFVAYPIFRMEECSEGYLSKVRAEETMWLLDSSSAASAYDEAVALGEAASNFGKDLRIKGWSALAKIGVPKEIIKELSTKNLQPSGKSPDYAFIGLRDLVLIGSKHFEHGTELDFSPVPPWFADRTTLPEPVEEESDSTQALYQCSQLFSGSAGAKKEVYERSVLVRASSERGAYHYAVNIGTVFAKCSGVGAFIGISSLEVVPVQIGSGTELRSRYFAISCKDLSQVVRSREECRAVSSFPDVNFGNPVQLKYDL